MERLQRIFSGVGGGASGGGPHPDSPLMDSSEQVYISSLALLKMLKHGMCPFPLSLSLARFHSRTYFGAHFRSLRDTECFKKIMLLFKEPTFDLLETVSASTA